MAHDANFIPRFPWAMKRTHNLPGLDAAFHL